MTSVYVGWKDTDKIPSLTSSYDFSYSTCDLYVPIGTKTIYQGKNYWSTFRNIYEYEFESVLLGDANDDGSVDVSDITTIASFILNEKATQWNEKNADANEDGSIDVSDITATATIILYSGLIIGKWVSCDSWSDRMAGIPDYAYIFYENGRGKSMDKGNYYPNQDYDFTWTYNSATGLLTMIDDEAYPGQIREHTATIKDLTKNGFILEEVDDYGEIDNTYFEKTDKPIYTQQGYEFK